MFSGVLLYPVKQLRRIGRASPFSDSPLADFQGGRKPAPLKFFLPAQTPNGVPDDLSCVAIIAVVNHAFDKASIHGRKVDVHIMTFLCL
jgi:hypothetical protein